MPKRTKAGWAGAPLHTGSRAFSNGKKQKLASRSLNVQGDDGEKRLYSNGPAPVRVLQRARFT